MKKTLLSIGLFCLSLTANAQCNAVTTINEDFETFTLSASLPQNCWTSSTGSPKVTIAAADGGKAIQLYSFMTPTVPFFIVSPELSAINGNSNLSFTLKSLAGTMTVQLGTLATATDFTTFQEVGTPIQVSTTTTTFSNIAIPASTTQKFIAFRAVAVAQHQAAVLDNIVYAPSLSTGESNLTTFKIYPNPSANKMVTISYDSVSENNNSVAIYSLTGAKVFETKIAESTTTLNLSALSSGVYILKLNSGDTVTTKKLVLK